MNQHPASQLVLGLDVGVNSLGWALIESNSTGPHRLVGCGVRVFPASVDLMQFERGKPSSHAAERRQARQQRRLTDRRRRRLLHLFHLLQRAGLMPEGDPEKAIPELDKTLLDLALNDPRAPARIKEERLYHVLPYWLRAKALDHPLTPYEFGRALYHLAQRRGFLSNRIAGTRDKKELGEVLQRISDLELEMKNANARTLGEYFSGLDPLEARIRNRYTSRQMYLDEFERIWASQIQYHSALGQMKDQIQRAIFYQRPPKSTSHLVGTCELEPGQRRAQWGRLEAQRYRILTQLNHARLISPEGRELPLHREQRDKLRAELERTKEKSFSAARRLLRLHSGWRFKEEFSSKEKGFRGNTTAARLIKVFGKRWFDLPQSQKDAIVEDLLSIGKAEVLERRGKEVWGLDQEKAKQFASLQLEEGHCRLSLKAIRKLMPHLEEGLSYAEAVKKVYGQFQRRSEPKDVLPPFLEHTRDLRNPAVVRALTEVRKVVNAIVRQYGKPDIIRIELARDMRKSAKEREELSKRNRENERARRQAAAAILREANIPIPSRRDIEKYLLWQECNGICPYTGKAISMSALFGPNPEFEVEHIIPFSRCLDDSFMNKTLCHVQENRTVKGNRTPWEAYGSDPERWREIMERVSRFQGRASSEKKRRFALKPEELEELDTFTSRQLNDTRYASKIAREYLGLLYGGFTDEAGRQRVQATRGGVTAFLRNAWKLNGLLADASEKSRDDHRHHAIDAIVVALTDHRTIKALSDAAARSWRRRPGSLSIPEPWPGFGDEVKSAVSRVVASHRPVRKVSGPLHDETFYANRPDVRVRKPLENLSRDEVDAIVDDRIRDIVKKALGGADPEKAFAKRENHPKIPTRDGRSIPIHKVRIRKSDAVTPIGKDSRLRHVVTGKNHHIEVVEVKKRGKTRWEGHLVTLREANERLRRKEPVVKRHHGPADKFLFSLHTGDTIELPGKGLYVIRSISQQQRGDVNVEIVSVNDARPVKDIKKSHDWTKKSIDKLRALGCRKVEVTPLGEIRACNE